MLNLRVISLFPILEKSDLINAQADEAGMVLRPSGESEEVLASKNFYAGEIFIFYQIVFF